MGKLASLALAAAIMTLPAQPGAFRSPEEANIQLIKDHFETTDRHLQKMRAG